MTQKTLFGTQYTPDYITAKRRFLKTFDKLEKYGFLIDQNLEIYKNIKNTHKLDFIFCKELYERNNDEDMLFYLLKQYERKLRLGHHNNGIINVIIAACNSLCLFYNQKVEI